MIKNKEDLKNIQIVCKNQEQVKDCLSFLEQLGFNVFYFRFDECYIIFYEINLFSFCATDTMHSNLIIECYDEKFVKTLQKFIKEKEEKKEEVKDFEVAEDGRITKINNLKSEKEIFICNSREGDKIKDLYPVWLKEAVEQGLAYATQKAKDRAMFKSKIETKLKNIAERLNAGKKINWEDENQCKFYIYYDYNYKEVDFCDIYWRKGQGAIYCLDEKFLEVAKKEIGEDDLVKYFKECFN